MRIIFLGAPGAGKGTQSEIISEKFGIPAVSTGAIIRAAIKNGTEMGKLAKEYADKGALVPDDVVIGIIRERLEQEDCKKGGYILDGFPRTVPQAEALDQMGIEIDVVISIEVPDEEIVERMSGRRVCEKCGATYHVVYNPSGDGSTCDKCGGNLTVRHDDTPEVVLDRLRVYHEQTEPLKEYYRKTGKLRTVRGQKELADTTKLVMAVLAEIFPEAAAQDRG
ncbi:MAG TPA: adenylate kinase [Bacillota bacterium]|nr:adenylate kinase [Clostridiales bacterium]HPT85831.1 adenylate kinase [Bacillota bacterium]